ncbi:MAG: tripartite tricarboxylate transporter substrate binding protein [Hydrogenophaga sp.]|uniref:tripartite tricarboxylate transporter substrate binding protein n=1 Tax=Hydrogenophaga sp. TaxID=1904254 RepID=UPI001D1FD19F|nr:tripartite tricarboxylate transporter substrate binding protein [Hydrogenophaga sp.]MBX3609212.1 tripartite tricarboxylate transporter substrate binding protein [Hydrogenophaga sp.]
MKTTNTYLTIALTAVALSTPLGALAQSDFPNRPVRIVVPFSAGGIVDTVARTVGDKLSTRLGQPVIVENKPGAGGAIATDMVAKSAPDGYTLLAVSPSHAVLPSLQKSVTWNPVRDFKAIAGVGIVPNIVVVNPGVQAKTMAEFVALAKSNAQPLTYGTAGMGTSNHLSGELLAQEAGIKLTQVPYKGQPDALTDVLAGRVDMMPLTAALALPHIKTGKLRALAVTTGKRATAVPDLPTVAEAAKLPDYEVGTWFGFVAPAATPDPVLRKLSADVLEILAMRDVQDKFKGLGMELAPQTAPEFDAFVAKEATKWARVIKQAGIEPN